MATYDERLASYPDIRVITLSLIGGDCGAMDEVDLHVRKLQSRMRQVQLQMEEELARADEATEEKVDESPDARYQSSLTYFSLLLSRTSIFMVWSVHWRLCRRSYFSSRNNGMTYRYAHSCPRPTINAVLEWLHARLICRLNVHNLRKTRSVPRPWRGRH